MESVKICNFRVGIRNFTFRVGIRNFASRTFCCFFLHYIHAKNLFCEVISIEYEFISAKSIDLKMNNLDLRGNTTEFKTLPTPPSSHRYILIYIFAMEFVKICPF